jgi:hypothetical protein
MPWQSAYVRDGCFSRGTKLALGMKCGNPVLPFAGDHPSADGKQRNEL